LPIRAASNPPGTAAFGHFILLFYADDPHDAGIPVFGDVLRICVRVVSSDIFLFVLKQAKDGL
jgi:hypothetical protein